MAMSTTDGSMSAIATANTGATAMARIVANVVDVQQNLLSQYESIKNALETLKDETRNSTQMMREDFKRAEDRAQKQMDDLRATHANEVARLMDLIKMLIVKESSTSTSQTQGAHSETLRMTPAQITYANAAPASSFFGQPGGVMNDLAAQAQAHYAACYIQQLQEQQRRAAAPQGGGFFGNHPGMSMSGVGFTGPFPQSQPAPPIPPPAATNVPKPPAPTSAAPVTTAAISSAASSNAGYNVTTTATFTAVTTAGSVVSSAATAPSSGLFGTASKPISTVTLPITNPPQPVKSDAPSGKLDTKPAFSFLSPKPSVTSSPTVSGATKPAASSIFAGIKPSENVFSKTPDTKQVIKKEGGDGPDDDDHDNVEEFEPQVEFKPVCPLPELVKVVTGEEDEKVIFEERCKLYRYSDDTKEWKERGTGIMKVLENNSTKKCRVVMRREQVLKVCANHMLLPGMTIQPMLRQEKAMTWYCDDFSEEEKSHEKLSARFASVEVANKFREVFENAVRNAGPISPSKSDSSESKRDEEPAASGDVKSRDNEKTQEDNTKILPQKGYGEQFKLQPGQWECPDCYSRTDANECPCCGAVKGGQKASAQSSKSALPASTIPLGGAASKEGQKFTFGVSAAAAAKDAPTTTSSNTPKSSLFGASLATSSSGSTASGGFTFGTKPSIFGGASTKASADGGSTLPTFSFSKKAESISTPSTVSSSGSTTPVTFSFKQAGSTPATSTSGGSLFGSKLFGASSAPAATDKKDEENEDKDTATTSPKVFGGGLSGNLSFASIAKSSSGSIFDAAHTQKAQAEFAAQAKSKTDESANAANQSRRCGADAYREGDRFAATATAELAVTDQKDRLKTDTTSKGDDDKEVGADEDYEPDVQFAPVVPLPDLVDVVTGEEEEETVFTTRAKLFRFNKETRENKERGIGDLKILRNPKTNAQRVVMRREQVHKVCANFTISPGMELTQKSNMPTVYSWFCRDYSESPEGAEEIFTAKFKTPEIAKEFHDKFMAAATRAAPNVSK